MDSLGRALSRASAALKALVSVDLIVQVAHLDSLGRALCCAGAAGQAVVAYNKSHGITSICIFDPRAAFDCIVTHLPQKSIEKFARPYNYCKFRQ